MIDFYPLLPAVLIFYNHFLRGIWKTFAGKRVLVVYLPLVACIVVQEGLKENVLSEHVSKCDVKIRFRR